MGVRDASLLVLPHPQCPAWTPLLPARRCGPLLCRTGRPPHQCPQASSCQSGQWEVGSVSHGRTGSHPMRSHETLAPCEQGHWKEDGWGGRARWKVAPERVGSSWRAETMTPRCCFPGWVGAGWLQKPPAGRPHGPGLGVCCWL